MYSGPPYNRHSRSPYGHGHVLFWVFKHMFGVFMLANIALGYVPHTPHHANTHGDEHKEAATHHNSEDPLWTALAVAAEHQEHDPHTEEEEIDLSATLQHIYASLIDASAGSYTAKSSEYLAAGTIL